MLIQLYVNQLKRFDMRKLIGVFFLWILAIHPAHSAESSEILGEWDLVLEVRGQSAEIKLLISEEADGLAGTWRGPRESIQLSNVIFDGNRLTFTMSAGRRGDTEVTLILEDSILSGSYPTRAGNASVAGKRSS